MDKIYQNPKTKEKYKIVEGEGFSDRIYMNENPEFFSNEEKAAEEKIDVLKGICIDTNGDRYLPENEEDESRTYIYDNPELFPEIFGEIEEEQER